MICHLEKGLFVGPFILAIALCKLSTRLILLSMLRNSQEHDTATNDDIDKFNGQIDALTHESQNPSPWYSHFGINERQQKKWRRER